MVLFETHLPWFLLSSCISNSTVLNLVLSVHTSWWPWVNYCFFGATVSKIFNKSSLQNHVIDGVKDENIGFDGYIGIWILWIYRIYIGEYFYMNIDISEIKLL